MKEKKNKQIIIGTKYITINEQHLSEGDNIYSTFSTQIFNSNKDVEMTPEAMEFKNRFQSQIRDWKMEKYIEAFGANHSIANSPGCRILDWKIKNYKIRLFIDTDNRCAIYFYKNKSTKVKTAQDVLDDPKAPTKLIDIIINNFNLDLLN